MFDREQLPEMVIQCCLGCGILGIVILVWGTIIGIASWLSWAGLILLGLLLWKDILQWWGSLGQLKKVFQDSPIAGRVLALSLSVILLATFVVALAPPVKFDALVYHLAFPKYYRDIGRIVYTPWNMFWGMPQSGEMLYTWAISAAGLQAGVLLGWMLGVLAVLGLIGALTIQLGALPAWVGVVALTAGFTFSTSIAWGYVDWIATAFGFCVFWMLIRWVETGHIRDIILAGSFAGFCLGTKYTAGIILLAGIAVILVENRHGYGGSRKLLTDLLGFLTPAVLLSSPWWIRNWLATGNPFYPFFFPSGDMDAFRQQFYNIAPWGDWRDIIFLPVMATITGAEGAPGYNASAGPLLLALGGCGILGWFWMEHSERTVLRIAIVMSGVCGLVWIVASRYSGYLIQTRLYTAASPIIAYLAGVGFKELTKIKFAGIRLGRVVTALVLLVYGLSVFEIVTDSVKSGAWASTLASGTSEEYLEKNLGAYTIAMQEVNRLPAGSRVLMLWEPRSLYCLPICIPDEILDRWKHDRFESHDSKTILASWQTSGFTHVLLNKSGMDFIQKHDTRYIDEDWVELEELIQNLPTPIVNLGDAYLLYSLGP
jgi:hypothetical protein